VFRFVRLERLAVLVLHQRHAEHVDAVSLARTLGVEYECAGDIVVLLRPARHQRLLHGCIRLRSSSRPMYKPRTGDSVWLQRVYYIIILLHNYYELSRCSFRLECWSYLKGKVKHARAG